MKRIGPEAVSFPENEASDFILDDSNKRHGHCFVIKHPILVFQVGLAFKYLSAMVSLFYKQP